MKCYKLMLAAVAGTLLFSSCMFRLPDSLKADKVKASGETEVLSYNYEQISSLFVDMADVEYTQSETTRVEFEVDKSFSDHYTFENKEGALNVVCDVASFIGNPVRVLRISAPDISYFELSSAADLKFMGGFNSEKSLEIVTAGASEVNGADMHVSDLNITTSGASDINLTGVECSKLNIAISGAGDVVVKNVAAEDVLVAVSGSGDITVTGKADHAGVNIAGAGDVDFSQLDCDDVSKSVNGMGKVKTKKN